MKMPSGKLEPWFRFWFHSRVKRQNRNQRWNQGSTFGSCPRELEETLRGIASRVGRAWLDRPENFPHEIPTNQIDLGIGHHFLITRLGISRSGDHNEAPDPNLALCGGPGWKRLNGAELSSFRLFATKLSTAAACAKPSRRKTSTAGEVGTR